MSAIETAIATGTWSIDPVHSSIGFEVKHFGVSTFRGSFPEVTGNVATADGRITGIEGSVAIASVKTVDDSLTGHLLSPDFFDAEHHPAGSFRSSSIEDLGEGRLKVAGTLELRGVSRPVELDAELEGVGSDPYGNERLGLRGSGVIDRTEFGISFNAPLPTGGVIVAEKVRLVLAVEAIRNAG